MKCETCDCIDDEKHVINDCIKRKSVNHYSCPDKVNFEDVYSDDKVTLDNIANQLLMIWDLENGKNAVRISDIPVNPEQHGS